MAHRPEEEDLAAGPALASAARFAPLPLQRGGCCLKEEGARWEKTRGQEQPQAPKVRRSRGIARGARRSLLPDPPALQTRLLTGQSPVPAEPKSVGGARDFAWLFSFRSLSASTSPLPGLRKRAWGRWPGWRLGGSVMDVTQWRDRGPAALVWPMEKAGTAPGSLHATYW